MEKTVICLGIEEVVIFCDHNPSCLEQMREMSRWRKVESGDGEKQIQQQSQKTCLMCMNGVRQ